MSLRRILVPLLVVALTACSGEDPDLEPADSGTPVDAGRPDAGSNPDAGTPGDAGSDADAGTAEDAGSDVDAGTPGDAGSDAGTEIDAGTPMDAGTEDDAGTPEDAGTEIDAGTPVDAGTPPESGPPVFTVAQWNLAYFGHATQGPIHSTSPGGTTDDLQIAGARDIMRGIRANLWGLVEIVDAADFDALKAQLPGYGGLLANSPSVPGGSVWYGNTSQKPGVLYDSSLTFRSAQLILTASATDFSGRPPLRVDFTTELQGAETPLVVIVLHMKALDDSASRDMRERASAALKTYLDQELPTQHVLVLGDWNDDVDESIALDNTGRPLPSPYLTFVNDPARYTFITRALSLAGEDSTVGFENMVDHTLATNEVATRLVPDSQQVLHVDATFPDYENVVTDHRPVLSRYAFSARTGPFLRLKQPDGGTYQAGSVLPITWTSWGVENVRLEVSTDGGAHWDTLIASVPARQGNWSWTTPDIAAGDVRVRVVDLDDASRLDASDASFSLVRAPARVFINEYLPNEPSPDGGTQGDVDYEFVELVNGSPFPVDLTGWSVWDSTNGAARHLFASGTWLSPGRPVVVFGGARGLVPGLTEQVTASSGTLGLNNSNDSVRLRLPDGGLADQAAYTDTVDNVSFNRAPDVDPDGGFVLHDVLTPGRSSSPGRRADGSAF